MSIAEIADLVQRLGDFHQRASTIASSPARTYQHLLTCAEAGLEGGTAAPTAVADALRDISRHCEFSST